MPFDLDQFIADCDSARFEGQLAVRDVVERAVREPAAVEAVLGTPSSWTIDKLHHSADMTILHFVWPPTLELFPHEHRMWSTVGIYGGREDNTFYRRVGDRVEPTTQTSGHAGDVVLLGVDGIHSVENPTRQWTAAIHVYGGDFFDRPRLQWDKTTGEPEPFDIANARRELAAAQEHARATGALPGG